MCIGLKDPKYKPIFIELFLIYIQETHAYTKSIAWVIIILFLQNQLF